MRMVKVFHPDQRRWATNNLYCYSCGNTHQWQIDLRLKHIVEVLPEGTMIYIDENRTKKIIHAIESNIHRILARSADRDKEIFRCANCGNNELEFQETMSENCYNFGCPGCWHCGNFIEKEWMLELCTECITSREGNIDEEDCFNICPHFDYGLSEVREHYNITLDELKHSLGYCD